jgi:hypothetical protein
MLMPVAEVIRLENRDMAELEEKVAVPELEHEAALSKVTEMPCFEVWNMSEREHEIPAVEGTEVPRLERPRHPKEATVGEIDAIVLQMQHWASMP